ncbi:MAG: hypothetical protein MK479_01395, partial [Planctomycetes bacterium]|nr:hypothetical protein [Planctomycetota bacterium]
MKNCNLRERTLVALLVICGSLTASVEAQDDQGKALGLFRQYISGSDREPGNFLGAGYVNLDCKDEDLSVALKTLSASAGVNIIADANVKEKITISVERLHWMEAMKLLAKQSNCKVVRDSPRLVRF